MAYFGLNGEQLSDEHGRLLIGASLDERRIGYDSVITDTGPVDVSTVYIPDDMRSAQDIEDGLPPLIFETAALLGSDEVVVERRSTGDEAIRAHLDVLGRIQGGRR